MLLMIFFKHGFEMKKRATSSTPFIFEGRFLVLIARGCEWGFKIVVNLASKKRVLLVAPHFEIGVKLLLNVTEENDNSCGF